MRQAVGVHARRADRREREKGVWAWKGRVTDSKQLITPDRHVSPGKWGRDLSLSTS